MEKCPVSKTASHGNGDTSMTCNLQKDADEQCEFSVACPRRKHCNEIAKTAYRLLNKPDSAYRAVGGLLEGALEDNRKWYDEEYEGYKRGITENTELEVNHG
jgi:hypothetical protein